MNRREAIKRSALLLGAALSSSTLAGALDRKKTSVGAARSFLDAKQSELVAAVAERVLPRTDTPGALDAGVPEFVDVCYGKYMSDDEKRVLREGIASLDAQSVSKRGKPFARLPLEQQDELLLALAHASHGKADTFLHKIRKLTITGYCTSELVGKNVLRYDPIPGAYRGCIPLKEGERVAWAL